MSHICCNPTGLLLLGESSISHIPKRVNVNFTFHCFIRARLLVLTAFRRDVVSIKPFTIEDLCNLATFHCLHSFKAFIRTIALLWNNPSISHRFGPQKDTTYRSNPNSLHLKGVLKSGADVHRLACDWVFPSLGWSCDAKLEAEIKKGSEAGEVLTQVSSPLHCHQRRSSSACILCPAWSRTYPGLQEDDKPDSR